MKIKLRTFSYHEHGLDLLPSIYISFSGKKAVSVSWLRWGVELRLLTPQKEDIKS